MKIWKKQLGALGLAVCLHAGVWAQSPKEDKADEYYTSFSYVKAVELYQDITSRGKGTELAYTKLAHCYRFLGKTTEAEAAYKKAIAKNEQDYDLYYYYAEMLKTNGKYDQAATWMKKYHEKVQSGKLVDDSGVELMELVKELKSVPERYKIDHLSINGPYSDFAPTFFGKQIVFTSSREGVVAVKRRYSWNNSPFLDIYVADKEIDGSLKNLEEFSGRVSTKFHEGPVCFNQQGTVMYFTRNNFLNGKKPKNEIGRNNLKIFRRDFVKGKWTNEQPVPFNSDEFSVGHPCLSEDGSKLYFISDMAGGAGGTDLYVIERGEGGEWGDPKNLAELNTPGNEMFPFVHGDGTIFFSSNGHPGLGGMDVFMAYPSKNGFEAPTNVGFPLNDSKDDFAFIIDENYKYGYFSSNRAGGKGDDDVYKFELKIPFRFRVALAGNVTNEIDKALVPGALVQLIDNEGDVLEEVTVGEDAAFEFQVDPDKEFVVKATHPDFYENQREITTVGLTKDVREVEADISILKDMGFALYGVVTDDSTHQILDSVTVVMINNLADNDNEEWMTDTNGDFNKQLSEETKLNDRVSFRIKLEKDGYLSKELTYNANLDEQGQIQLHEKIDLTMKQIRKGDDIGKLLDLKPIYFDYKSYDIRDDAAEELDKIVAAMRVNPKMVIELGSHSDARGSSRYNMRLSDKRAKASAAYVISQGIPSSRIYGKGYGESKIQNRCKDGVDCSDEEHGENRRTEFIIVSM